MAAPQPSQAEDVTKSSHRFQNTYKKYDEILPNLCKQKVWNRELILYQDFWQLAFYFKGVLLVQDHFRSKPEDIIMVTYPKSGTTWFRALIFATINRNKYDFPNHPLLENNPREICPFLEKYMDRFESMSPLEDLPSPRFLSTHIPYTLLPKSVTTSDCRFVYICRDPKDVFISLWHFVSKLTAKEMEPLSLEDAFESFCQGVSPYGPYWDHMLSYWKASLEIPEKMLFLKYEDMKREPVVHVKRLAEFLGMPFSLEEENKGAVEQIIELCSFEKMSNLEVNKITSSENPHVQNPDFFRKGEIGDWKNHLTLEMAARLDQITEEKLRGTGLIFFNKFS